MQDFYSRVEDITAKQAQAGRHIVVSDRFCTSTFAYQTIGLGGKERHRMMKWLLWISYENTPALPQPNLVIFLDTPVAVSLQRLKEKKKDFFETKAKLTAIRNSYLKLAIEQKWHVIPSVDKSGQQRTREDLHQDVWVATLPYLDSLR